MDKNGSRAMSIDIARALAMLMVVYEHLLRCYDDSPSPLMPSQTMHSVIHALTFFHMPTFFILAGFCQASSRRSLESLGDYGRFEWKKFRRLMIPYFVVCAVQLAGAIAAGIRSVHDIPSEIYRAIVLPVWGPAGHGWFLVALMSLFIVWPLLNLISGTRLMLIFIAAALLDIYKVNLSAHFNLDMFQIDILITYLPVFAFGAVICRLNRGKLLGFDPVGFAMITLVASALVALCISLKTSSFLETSPLRPVIYSTASLTARISGGTAIIKLSVIIENSLRSLAGFFCHLGRYSYDIYLYHILTITIMITIIEKLNLSPAMTVVSAVFAYIGAIAAAYAGCRIIRISKRLSSLILGDPV
jgi:peptidoglycan/LPS O-acetylase OafA/YrhL